MRICADVIRQAVVFVWVLAALFGWTSSPFAGGDEPRMTYPEMRANGRPADFYRLGFVADENICNDTLELLNRPMAIRLGLRLPYDIAKILSDFFLRTSAGIAWEPRWIVNQSGIAASFHGPGILDTAMIDIFNTGRPREFRRLESRLGGIPLHRGYTDSDTSQSAGDHGSPVDPVHGMRAYDTGKTPFDPGSRLVMDAAFARAALATSEDPWSGEHVFFDIIKIGDSYHVLLTSALFRFGEAKVYLATFAGHRNRKLICEFESRYQIVDE